MITIVDYGMGNMGSVRNMLLRAGVDSVVTSSAEGIKQATRIILPGVGAFDAAMRRLEQSGLRDALDEKALTEKVPVLGICLGMQLLCNGSEEGTLKGLGWIDAKATRLTHTEELKVPHMGWNVVRPVRPSPLVDNLGEEARFYFVHSYAVHVADPASSLLKCTYGIEFDAAINRGNIYGAQFHPEKSHRFGMAFLKAFADIPC
ncbi:imidazole glycerol phosphate synthase subunit HisH [Altererythrobacter confluentis]|uniref:Imidazole glycerol phosphate synthase subunit HisH n=1 Tax=Allopontixanthobacter confluentis TaxID=1849021 RepID=A0A6L7GIM4_9SPHN|nr:imidazole glycerol phosphate synthase subunit HisH [Allopontixanthobacter confluentis]MXP15154.1 imidazole glycerol phosphate synthase subunit HisH [Allopontixanthobacter confluentis]